LKYYIFVVVFALASWLIFLFTFEYVTDEDRQAEESEKKLD